jgi:replication-associated recombination protein RarA
MCDGDARIALNSLQLAFQTRKEISSSGSSHCVVTLEDIKEGIKVSKHLHFYKSRI